MRRSPPFEHVKFSLKIRKLQFKLGLELDNKYPLTEEAKELLAICRQHDKLRWEMNFPQRYSEVYKTAKQIKKLRLKLNKLGGKLWVTHNK